MAVILGLPALLQAIGTIGVGGAIGYKAQKDLKDSNIDIRNLEDPQIKMLRAMLMPTQTVGQEIKDRLFRKDEAEKKDEPEKKEETKSNIQFQIKPKPQSRPPEPPEDPNPVEKIAKDLILEKATEKTVEKIQEPEAPAIIGIRAQEGGKQIKDVTAGFSIQKDIVPSLLEQGKAAIPMKNFFEKDTNVVNYKIGDTIGAYGGDVERSLDIEANVKSNFNLDNFADVIKQGAKEYNQDAVFIAESAPVEKSNTVGFSIDFGSNLNITDALEVSKRISDTAKLDGFTFKIKNLDTSGASIYLPQEKDLEMTQKVIDKFKPTDQINLAGFMMPDGRMLNFSISGNVRDTEHRRIGLVTHPGSDGISFGPMYDFMNKTGAIRLAGNTNRLYAEISGKPSTTQIRKIAEEYNKNRNKYDSLTIALAIPKTEGALGGVKPEEAIDLNKMTYRLPNEAFIEINGTEANANDILKKFQAADVMGKTFTGIRQINIPEFSGMSPKDAARKIVNLGNNMSKIIEETGIKTLDKPKTKSYNMKLFQKGKDY